MTNSIPFPRTDLENVNPTVLAGRYTFTDVIRFLLPLLAGFLLFGPLGILPGALIGLAFAEITFNDRPIDQFLWYLAKYRLGMAVGQWPETTTVADKAVVTETGTVIGFVRIGGVNTALLSSDETVANLETVTDLFHRMDYPVTFISTQRRIPLDDYATVSGTTELTDHYAAVQVFPADLDAESMQVLDDRCEEVRSALTGVDMYADRVTGDEFHTAVDRLVWKPEEASRTGFTVEDEHRQVLYIKKYPSELPTEWLADVLSVDAPGLVDVVQTVRPASKDELDDLENEEAKAHVEQLTTTNRMREREMKQIRQDIESIFEVEVQGSPVLRYGVYIVVRATSSDDLQTTIDKVSSKLRNVKYGTPRLRINDAVRTVSPLFRDYLGKTVIAPGLTVAAGFPWAAYDTIEETGVVFGVDTEKSTPVVLDRFNWSSPHMSVMGMTGSGKTFFTKLLLLRCAAQYDDLQILILDLKPGLEYGDVIESVQCKGKRWAIGDRTQDDPELLENSLAEAYQLCREHDGPTILVVDEAHRILDDNSARGILNTLIREGRTHEVSVMSVTQDTSEFTRLDEVGEGMLRQVECDVFFRHKKVETDVERFFRLSEDESRRLQRLREGEEVAFSEAIVRGPVNTKIRVEATEEEAAVIHDDVPEEQSEISESTTDFGEVDFESQTPYDLIDGIDSAFEKVAEQVTSLDVMIYTLFLSSGISVMLLISGLLSSFFALTWHLAFLFLLPITIVVGLLIIGYIWPPEDFDEGDEM